jgi:hypothetical protein
MSRKSSVQFKATLPKMMNGSISMHDYLGTFIRVVDPDWLRIRFGFSGFLDLDPDSETGSGSSSKKMLPGSGVDISLQSSGKFFLKGTVSRDFRPSVFFR